MSSVDALTNSGLYILCEGSVPAQSFSNVLNSYATQVTKGEP